MYGFSLDLQLRGLLLFLGLGFALGCVYDILRIIRLSISGSKILLYGQDVFFVLLCAAATFCFSLSVCYGEFHSYMLLGELTGFFIYYVTMDAFVRKTADRIARALRRFYTLAFRVFSAPVRLFAAIAGKVGKILGFPVKKLEFFLNFLLQKMKRMLYNKFGYLDVKNRKRKRAPSDEET